MPWFEHIPPHFSRTGTGPVGLRVRFPINFVPRSRLRLVSDMPCSYDCMYLASPNQFWTDAEGGYINVSFFSISS